MNVKDIHTPPPAVLIVGLGSSKGGEQKKNKTIFKTSCVFGKEISNSTTLNFLFARNAVNYGCFPVLVRMQMLGLAVVSRAGVRHGGRDVYVYVLFFKEGDNCSVLTLQSC